MSPYDFSRGANEAVGRALTYLGPEGNFRPAPLRTAGELNLLTHQLADLATRFAQVTNVAIRSANQQGQDALDDADDDVLAEHFYEVARHVQQARLAISHSARALKAAHEHCGAAMDRARRLRLSWAR